MRPRLLWVLLSRSGFREKDSCDWRLGVADLANGDGDNQEVVMLMGIPHLKE